MERLAFRLYSDEPTDEPIAGSIYHSQMGPDLPLFRNDGTPLAEYMDNDSPCSLGESIESFTDKILLQAAELTALINTGNIEAASVIAARRRELRDDIKKLLDYGESIGYSPEVTAALELISCNVSSDLVLAA